MKDQVFCLKILIIHNNPLVFVSVRNPDISPDMLIFRALDKLRYVIHIPLRSEDHISPVFKDNANMIMFLVFKNPVIKNDVAGFRNKAFFSFVIPYLNIALCKFLPGDTTGQMASFTCIRSDGDLKSRFPAAIIYKCRTP